MLLQLLLTQGDGHDKRSLGSRVSHGFGLGNMRSLNLEPKTESVVARAVEQFPGSLCFGHKPG